MTKNAAEKVSYLDKFTVRKVQDTLTRDIGTIPDSLEAWMAHYLRLAVSGVRSEAMTKKITLHLSRFHTFFVETYGHDRISTCLKRDVVAWQAHLEEMGLAHSTINNCLASLSGFTTWVQTLNTQVFPAGNPTKGVGELGLPPLEPRALKKEQVRSLKNICDRLDRVSRQQPADACRSGSPVLS
jgi:site-specific recombinase XerC